MLSVLGFLVILGPLVVVHEFGHYIFARIFNVKAEIFSIGFGPRLWSRQLGETEWRVSAIPMGGYVKLLGEDKETALSEQEQKRALHRQAPWKRFFIFFGGPLFNFLFAIVVFMAILAIGEQQLASYVGRVVHGSAAEKAGFQSGDRILAVNGKSVRKFEDVLIAINDNPERLMKFTVQHAGTSQPAEIATEPSGQSGYSVYGESTSVGDIDGLFPTARSTHVGISNPQSAAGKAGIATGSQILQFNGQALGNWEDLEKAYSKAAPGADFSFLIKGAAAQAKGEPKTVTLKKPADPKLSMGQAWGLYSSELFVEKVVHSSPAEGAGLRSGDRLVGIGSQDVQSFFELKEWVQKSGEKDGKVTVRWERDGKAMSSTVTPTANASRDPLLKKVTQYTIGIMPMLSWAEPVTVVERIWNPFVLLYKGTERMLTFSWRNLVSLQKMFTGDVSVATLGGPIMIGKIAGESLSRGLVAFLSTMAILSIGLGVLNILPVPVLDGGHLLLLGIESIRGKPLTIRQMEIVQQVGLSLILLLMVVVIRNDIARLPFFD